MVTMTPLLGRALAAGAVLAMSISLLTGTAGAAQRQERYQPDAGTQNSLQLPMKANDQGSYVRRLQERLEWLGYDISWRDHTLRRFGKSTKRAVTAAQDKFYLNENGAVDRNTWNRIDAAAGEVGALPRQCRSEAKTLCIDKSAKVIRYVNNGKVVKTIDVRFGVPGLDTPSGTFRVWLKWADATSGINGPDQPRAPMPWALFFAGDVAVHYSPTFANAGYYPGGGSHGCVNVADLAAVRWLFYQIPMGTLVHVYR